MLDLTQYPKFASDIGGDVVSIHPVIVIKSDPEIYLSQNDETMNVNGTPIHFKSLNLKVPSIKESVDLETRKIKINNVSMSFSNHEYFSDLFATQNFINKYVEIYWKSQSCTDLEDCLFVYKAVIKRLDHDYDNVKLLLEDETESVVHKEVPISIIEPENAYSDKYVHKTIPMTYGTVDNAPAVLWKTMEYDTTGLNYLYALSDRFDLTQLGEPDIFSGHNITEQNSTNSRSPLSIFTGNYLWIPGEYVLHQNSYDYTEKIQWEIEQSRIRFVRIFEGETPKNPIAENIAQVVVNRVASSALLLDSSEVEGYNYLGSDDGISIEGKDLLLYTYSQNNYGNTSISSWDTYGGIPKRELDAYEDGTDDPEPNTFLPIGALKTSSEVDLLEFGRTGDGGSGGDMSDTFLMHVTDDPSTYNGFIPSVIYYLAQLNVELVTLPDSKKLYDMYVSWYTMTGGSASDIKDFNDGNHRWTGYPNAGAYATPIYQIEFTENPQHYWSGDPIYGHILFNQGRVVTDQGVVVSNPHGSENLEGYNDGDVSAENMEWGQGYEISNVFWDSYTPEGEVDPNYFGILAGYPYGDKPLFPDENISGNPRVVQFWHLIELVEERKYGYTEFPDNTGWFAGDIPRYKINGEISTARDIETTTGYLYSYSGGGGWNTFRYNYNLYQKSFQAEWNGVDKNIWGNTGEHGGYTDSIIDITSFSYPDIPDYNCFPFIRTRLSQSNFNSSSAETFNWNKIYSNEENWFVHVLEGGAGFGGEHLPEGLLIPTRTFYPYTPLSGGEGMPHNYQTMNYLYSYRYPNSFQSIDTFESSSDEFVTLQDGSSLTTDTRVGIAYALEDAGVEDSLSGSGVTQFWGKFSYIPQSENTTNISTASLKVNFLEADLEEDNENTLESDGVGVLKEELFSDLSADNSERQFISNSDYPTSIISGDWADPDDFNAGVLRFWVDGDVENPNAQLPLQIRLHHLGVKHIIDIEKLFDKDFYVNSSGRSAGSNPVAIINDIIQKELEMTPALHSSFDNVLNQVEGVWKLAFSITEKVDSRKLIEDIAQSTSIIPFFKSSKEGSSLAFANIKNTYTSSNRVIRSSDVVKFSFTRTKIEKVKTMCRVKFKKDYARDSYREVTEYRDAYDLYGNGDKGYVNGYSKASYGLNPDNPGDSVLEIENEYIRDLDVANRLRDFLVAFHCNQHNILKITLPLTYIDIEISDIISLDGIVNNMLCYGESYVSEVTRNGQQIYPYFMVTSVNKSTKSISIECIQMHNLEPNSDVVSAGSGDVLRRGISPDMDDYNSLENYLLGFDKYFTEGQKKASDMSLDGLVNYNDLALLGETYDLIEQEEEEEEVPEMYIETDNLAGWSYTIDDDITDYYEYLHNNILAQPETFGSLPARHAINEAHVYFGLNPDTGIEEPYGHFGCVWVISGVLGNPDFNVNIFENSAYQYLNYNTGDLAQAHGYENLISNHVSEGYCVKVGTEWMRVNKVTINYIPINPYNSLLTTYHVSRGLFTNPEETPYDPTATEAYQHGGNEQIFIYSSDPVIVNGIIEEE